jgi:hypothetical protein
VQISAAVISVALARATRLGDFSPIGAIVYSGLWFEKLQEYRKF